MTQEPPDPNALARQQIEMVTRLIAAICQMCEALPLTTLLATYKLNKDRTEKLLLKARDPAERQRWMFVLRRINLLIEGVEALISLRRTFAEVQKSIEAEAKLHGTGPALVH